MVDRVAAATGELDRAIRDVRTIAQTIARPPGPVTSAARAAG